MTDDQRRTRDDPEPDEQLEQLSLYIDDELAVDERKHLEAELALSEPLRKRLDELQRVDHALRLFAEIAEPTEWRDAVLAERTPEHSRDVLNPVEKPGAASRGSERSQRHQRLSPRSRISRDRLRVAVMAAGLTLAMIATIAILLAQREIGANGSASTEVTTMLDEFTVPTGSSTSNASAADSTQGLAAHEGQPAPAKAAEIARETVPGWHLDVPQLRTVEVVLDASSDRISDALLRLQNESLTAEQRSSTELELVEALEALADALVALDLCVATSTQLSVVEAALGGTPSTLSTRLDRLRERVERCRIRVNARLPDPERNVLNALRIGLVSDFRPSRTDPPIDDAPPEWQIHKRLLGALRLADAYRLAELDDLDAIDRTSLRIEVSGIHNSIAMDASDLKIPTLGIALIDDLGTLQSRLAPDIADDVSWTRLLLDDERGSQIARRAGLTSAAPSNEPSPGGEEGTGNSSTPLTSRLIIASNPTRARVTLDGALVGRTPIDIEHTADSPTVLVVIRRAYFEPTRLEIDMTQPETTIEVELIPSSWNPHDIWNTYQFGGDQEHRSGQPSPPRPVDRRMR